MEIGIGATGCRYRKIPRPLVGIRHWERVHHRGCAVTRGPLQRSRFVRTNILLCPIDSKVLYCLDTTSQLSKYQQRAIGSNDPHVFTRKKLTDNHSLRLL